MDKKDPKYINRQNLLDMMREDHICHSHQKRIFNCYVKDNYEIYYETCCVKFSDIIHSIMGDYPIPKDI